MRALQPLTLSGKDVLPLVEAVFPFAAFPEALAAASRPGAMKILVEVGRT